MSKTLLPDELQALLRGNPALRRLAKAARHQDTAETPQVRALRALPLALRERVTLIDDEHRWLAMVETSATAQMLRFHLPRLERALTAKPVKILVTGRRGAAAVSRSSQPSPSGPTLDADSARHIREAAGGIRDEGLRKALERLGMRG